MRSTTRIIKNYQMTMNEDIRSLIDEDPGYKYNFVDTMGYNDDKIRLTDKEISKLIQI